MLCEELTSVHCLSIIIHRFTAVISATLQTITCFFKKKVRGESCVVRP